MNVGNNKNVSEQDSHFELWDMDQDDPYRFESDESKYDTENLPDPELENGYYYEN